MSISPMSDKPKITPLRQVVLEKFGVDARTVDFKAGETARLRMLVKHFSKHIGWCLAAQLKASISVEMLDDKETKMLRENEAAILLRFRIYQDEVLLLIPTELSQELAARVLESKVRGVITAPNDEEQTAISYLAAKTLAEDKLFTRQRIYVAGVETVSITMELLKNFTNLYWFSVTIDGSTYPLAVSLTSGAWRRSCCYARLQGVSADVKDLLKGAETRWRLSADLEPSSLSNMLNWRVGHRISLSFLRAEQTNGQLEQIAPRLGLSSVLPIYLNGCAQRGIAELRLRIE